ncbi:MAG: IPT/TIG domain-containing protein, partial [bacterium]
VKLTAGDLTSDGYSDLVVAPTNERTVLVYNLAKKATYRVTTAARGSVIAQPLDLKKSGSLQLVTSVGSTLETWKFQKNAFTKFTFDLRKLQVSGSSISRITLQPMVGSITPTTLTAGKGKVTLTITGQNLGSGSRVLLNQIIPATKVVARADNTLLVTIDTKKLKKKTKYDVIVINGDSGQTTYQSIRTR